MPPPSGRISPRACRRRSPRLPCRGAPAPSRRRRPMNGGAFDRAGLAILSNRASSAVSVMCKVSLIAYCTSQIPAPRPTTATNGTQNSVKRRKRLQGPQKTPVAAQDAWAHTRTHGQVSHNLGKPGQKEPRSGAYDRATAIQPHAIVARNGQVRRLLGGHTLLSASCTATADGRPTHCRGPSAAMFD